MKSPSAGDSVSASIPAACRSVVQGRHRRVAGRIGIAGDIETAQCCREQDGGEVIGGERGDHRQGRHDAAQRQHGLDAFAGRHHVVRHTEPDAMSEEMAHRPPRRVDRRLVAAGRVEPGAVRAGDPAVEIGDRGDQCRPGLGRCVGIGAIVAARMKPQRAACVQSRNAASAQIRFGDCARNRLRHGEEPACGFGRSARRRRGLVPGRPPRVGPWQAEEGSRLVERVAQAIEAAIQGDEVEQIAMFAGGGVGLMCS